MNRIRKAFKTLGKKLSNLKWSIRDAGKVRLRMIDGDGSTRNIRCFFGKTLGDHTKKTSNGAPVIYFKVNRVADYTFSCIQGWLNIINELGYDYYFVCDDNHLRYRILRECYFGDTDIKFIKSYRHRLKGVAKNLGEGSWMNATYAHLTPFYHAKKNGFACHWDIDADDTTILLEPSRAAEVIREAEKLAKENNFSALSLDMWRSKTGGRHWSLGILFISDTTDFCKVFEGVEDLSWGKDIKEHKQVLNLDWFMTHLKKETDIKIETFYVENMWFIHWENLIMNTPFSWISYWKDGKIYYPIIQNLYHREKYGVKDIADCYKIDIGVTEEECLSYFENELSLGRFLTDEQRELYGLEGFASNSHFYIKQR